MKFPKYEKIRNKRQRDFETRMLSLATPRPKNRFFVLLNAPFTLWFLSAVVLGFSSLYYTAYKQCRADAAKVRDDYSIYAPELMNRQIAFAISLGSAKSIADVNRLMKIIPRDAVQAKDKDLSQIFKLKEEASLRIIFPPIRESELLAKAKNHKGFDKFIDLYNGQPSMSLSDRDLPNLMKFNNDFMPATLMEGLQRIFLILPACGPGTVASILIGEDSPEVAYAVPFVPFVEKLTGKNVSSSVKE